MDEWRHHFRVEWYEGSEQCPQMRRYQELPMAYEDALLRWKEGCRAVEIFLVMINRQYHTLHRWEKKDADV